MQSVIGRRQLLGAAAAFAAGFARPASASAAPRILSLENLHTGEKLRAEYWTAGAYLPDAPKAIVRILRDFRTGEIHPINPRLLDLLSHLHGQMETTSPFQVISGYRSPATNAGLRQGGHSGVASKSLHMEGIAIDVRIPGKPLAGLHRAALSLHSGGVGYYPASNFVHVDIGRVRRWSGA
jgi:uncharacterized protein YcbK (DUF882 family)